SVERRQSMKAYGAELILVSKADGMEGARDLAEKMEREGQGKVLDQFSNDDNWAAHYEGTGPEIWRDTHGEVTHFVSAMGTTGTITGVSRYLKKTRGKPIVAVGVEPAKSPVITQTLAGEPPKPSPHKIQGIGAGFVPAILDLSLVDRVETVTDEEAIETARRLAKEEGILCGISCGAAAAVALRMARLPEFAGKTIVTVLPDSGERYLSTVLFQQPA
ncbi:MAG: pyridoxal-phosphate dependent enzyme, partial [Alphaproteobacteria bacterium]